MATPKKIKKSKKEYQSLLSETESDLQKREDEIRLMEKALSAKKLKLNRFEAIESGVIPKGKFSGEEAAKHDAAIEEWLELGKPNREEWIELGKTGKTTHIPSKADDKGNTSKSPAEKYAFMREVWEEENKTGNPQGGPMWTEDGGGTWGGWHNLPKEKMDQLMAIKDPEARMQKAVEFFSETDEAKVYDKYGGALGETMSRYKYNTGRSPDELALYAQGQITLDELNEVNPDGTPMDRNSTEYGALRKKVDSLVTEYSGAYTDDFSKIVQDKVVDVYQTTGMYEDESGVKRRHTLENPSPTYESSYKHRPNVRKGIDIRGGQPAQPTTIAKPTPTGQLATIQPTIPQPQKTDETGSLVTAPDAIQNPSDLGITPAPVPNSGETEQQTEIITPNITEDKTTMQETLTGAQAQRPDDIGTGARQGLSTQDINAIARSIGSTAPTASSQTQTSIQPLPLSAGTMSTPTLGSTPIYSSSGAVYQNIVQTRGNNLRKAAEKVVAYKAPDVGGIETALQYQKTFSENAQQRMNDVINESYGELGSLGMTTNQINKVLNDPSSSYAQKINKTFASLTGVAALLKDIDAHADAATDADKTLNIDLSKDQSDFIDRVINGDPELMEQAYEGKLGERLSEFRTNQSLLGVLTEMKKNGALEYDKIDDSLIKKALVDGNVGTAKFVERLFKERFSDDKLNSLYDLLPAFQKEKISKKKFTDTVRDVFEQDAKPQWRQIYEKMNITIDNVPTDKLDSLPVYVENQTKDIRNNVEFTPEGATNSAHREDKNNILSGGTQGYTFYDGKEWKFINQNDPKNLSAGFAGVVEGLPGVISTSTNITDEMLNVEKALTQQGYANIKLSPEQEQIAKDNIAKADTVGGYTDLLIGGITKVGLMPGMTDKNGTTIITKVIPVEGDAGAFTTEVNTPDGKTQKGVIIPIPTESAVNTLFGDDWVEWVKETVGLGAEKDILLGANNTIFIPGGSLVPRDKGGWFNKDVPGYALAKDGKVIDIDIGGGKKEPFVIDQSLMIDPVKKTYDKITKDLAKTPVGAGYDKTQAMAGKDTFMYVGSDGVQKSMDIKTYFDLAKTNNIIIPTVKNQADFDALKDGEPFIDSEGKKIKGDVMSFESFDKIKYINK